MGVSEGERLLSLTSSGGGISQEKMASGGFPSLLEVASESEASFIIFTYRR
jgi:hypothetical protein